MLYQVLVVDDERIIREGLSRHVPWHEHNMQVIATAADASAALGIIHREKIDVLVTDIKMSGKSGLDLIRDIQAEKYQMQVIVISSYDDFLYAQQACAFDLVCDYVLKPIDVLLLEKALDHASEKLEKAIERNRLFDSEKYIRLLQEMDETGFDKQTLIQKIMDKDAVAMLGIWQKAVSVLHRESCSSENAKRFCIHLMTAIENAFNVQSAGECAYLTNNANIKNTISSFGKKETLFAFVNQQLLCVCENCSNTSLICKTQLIAAAIIKTKNSYSNRDFNLASLAHELNVTPNYLSLKFHDEMDTTFTHYLTELRIQKSKELLENPCLKIVQIAEKVGFSDEKYFIRVFKLLTKTTPKQFQQKLMNYKV
ncbi:MAG: response regulator [Ruthenibacterium sp.]